MLFTLSYLILTKPDEVRIIIFTLHVGETQAKELWPQSWWAADGGWEPRDELTLTTSIPHICPVPGFFLSPWRRDKKKNDHISLFWKD